MVRKSRKRRLDPDRVDEAEKQIIEYFRSVKYTATEYSLEYIEKKYNNNCYGVPSYHIGHAWEQKKQFKFIESVFMGLPLPFIFFGQVKNGRTEIIDGLQRMKTISDFMNNKITLKGLKIIPAANGMRYSDFPKSRQIGFRNRSLRAIIFDYSTSCLTREELFLRINTGRYVQKKNTTATAQPQSRVMNFNKCCDSRRHLPIMASRVP